jgi:hypothetical protein
VIFAAILGTDNPNGVGMLGIGILIWLILQGSGRSGGDDQ